ncbi:DUF4912 domain-containing protein [Athalassotoga saccharophila]|uniref:DUF4912 domain-containing protein n=1 Tax=Athalassotoga saccharophila TaxID=1441386 RepID=UPI00137A4122|nr:DUF4912 domain-containing protein [Athalassotoga saccharophila]BBJ27858.1 hypothetical protein ATHSA_0750 [Athalassotoga saccharophila]
MKEEKTIRQLKKEAMSLRIKGYYNMTKAELAEAISKRKMELAKKMREIDKMEIEELRGLSKEFNLKIPWKSTRANFVKKLKEFFESLKLGQEIEKTPPSISSMSVYEEKITVVPKQSLPSTYYKDKFVGLEVNQNWIHFYWDFSPQTYEIIKNHPHVVLRIYDVTYIEFNGTNAHRTFEMEIDEKMRKYYVYVPQPGADYLAEIGYRENERFIPILRSNLVSTPPSMPRMAQMELWMDLRTKRKFTEIGPSRKILRIEKLTGSASLPTSGARSGGGSFFFLSGRRGS